MLMLASFKLQANLILYCCWCCDLTLTNLSSYCPILFFRIESVCNSWMSADCSSFGDEALVQGKHRACQQIRQKWAVQRQADDADVDNPLQLVEPDGRWPDEDLTRNVSLENPKSDSISQ